jgi:hypothetical protein
MGAPAHGAGAVDDATHIEAAEKRYDQGQSAAAVVTGTRVEAGEGGGQIVQRAPLLELVSAAEVCHNTVANLPVGVPKALDEVNVLIHASSSTDLLDA